MPLLLVCQKQQPCNGAGRELQRKVENRPQLESTRQSYSYCPQANSVGGTLEGGSPGLCLLQLGAVALHSFVLNSFCRCSREPLFKKTNQKNLPVQTVTKASNLPRTREIISQLVQPLSKYNTSESLISCLKRVPPFLGYILLSAHTSYAEIYGEIRVQNSRVH